jgi:ceramide glucosyltransferase
MVFRGDTLREIGGFESIADYLADDYQLGRRISARGYRIEFAPAVVSTDLGSGSWGETWRHQLRWSRTIRVSRPSGYYGYVVTQATFWALVAFATGQYGAGALALVIRMLAGIVVGRAVLKDRRVVTDAWMMPARDLFGLAVWIGGAFGRHVQWRDRRLKLRSDGRICEEPQVVP